MAESGLSLGWADFKAEVGYYLGYGRTSGNWSTAEESEIEGVVQSGVRRVYYPPILQGQQRAHEWSWLQPSTSLSISDGTGDYDLPDDFGRLIGAFHYAADDYLSAIRQIPLGQLLDLRSHSNVSSDPYYVATRFKESDGSTGSRQEALFWPEPFTARTLSYQYEAYQFALSDSAPYPLGGMQLSELYLESCLAVAESRMNDQYGLHNQAFQTMLADAILRDRKRGPKHYGNMGGGERDVDPQEWRRGNELYDGAYSIIYDGNQV